MMRPAHWEISLDCPECGKEVLVAVEYGETNYDPRDGYRECDYVAEIAKRNCQCEERDILEERAIKAVEE